MSKRRPIRIIVPRLDMSYRDESVHSSSHPSVIPSRHTQRIHISPENRRRRQRSQSRSANLIPDIQIQTPSPVVARDTIDTPPSVVSPPFYGGPSPGAEPELLPGGGVQIPPGFHYREADQGHYRPREFEEGDPENARVLGRMGLPGMFKGLKKIPTAIVKASRSYGPRHQEHPSMPSLPETDHETDERPAQMLREMVADQGDVETYLEPEEEEAHAREEQLLHEYIQRKRLGRDRTFRKRSRRERHQRPIPPPQPVLLPGANSPAASQISHSQAGHSNVPPTTREAQLEAEEIREELEALEQAHERERARKVYAADIVRQPLSSLSSDPADAIPDSHSGRHHSPATGRRHYRPSSHVVSRWSAERDRDGRRRDNGLEDDLRDYSLASSILRFIQRIRDMPWVGDRVAADFVPGGSKPKQRTSRYYTSSLGTDTRFSSPTVTDAVGGPPLPVQTRRTLRKAGPSWYSTQGEVLVLPIGVDPPPGFIPYPFPEPQHEPQHEPQQATTSANGEGVMPTPAAAPSNANVDPVPSALRPAGSAESTPEAGYLTGEAYQFLPGQAPKPGQPSLYVPTGDGRHQPLIIPGMGTRPAYVYSHPGPPNFVPATR